MKKLPFISALLLAAVLAATGCGGTKDTKDARGTYVNPLKTAEGDTLRIADPFVYKHEGMYYLTGTTGGDGFDYYTSPDLVTWSGGGTLYKRPADHFGTDCFWAPEVKYYRGRFYMTYSCADPVRGILLTCLAVSDTPDGPFRDLRAPWFAPEYSAIDCHIFVDDDPRATPYLYYSCNGHRDGYAFGEIYAVRLKDDLSGFDGEPMLISKASQPWELVRSDVNRCNEGPFVFKHGDTYYMTYSANDTGYEFYGVGVSTAPSPLGPWTKADDNPLMTTDLSAGISSPGHNSIVESPDGSETFIVYHRHADPHGERPSWDRVTCIDRIRVDGAGRLRMDGPTTDPQRLPE